MTNFIIIQIIGGIAYCLLSYSYFKKEKKDILLIQLFSYVFFGIHYYLLDGITGVICNIVGFLALLMIYLFEKYHLKHKVLFSFLFISFLFVVNIINFQNFFSIFPLIASIISIISFFLNDENGIRGIGIISAICWLIYAIYYKSYISIVFEIITLFDVLIAFLKNHKKNRTFILL